MQWKRFLFLVACPTVIYPVTIIASNYYNTNIKWVIILATLMYGLTTFFSVFPLSLGLRQKELQGVLRSVLIALDAEIAAVSDPDCMLRYNIMEIKGMPFRKYLKIANCSSSYSPAEKEIQWEKGNGACGRAWQDRKQIVYDINDSYQHNMTGSQEELTSNVKCCICTPIIGPLGHIKGTLNIDSISDYISKAQLNSDKIKDRADAYAKLISYIL